MKPWERREGGREGGKEEGEGRREGMEGGEGRREGGREGVGCRVLYIHMYTCIRAHASHTCAVVFIDILGGCVVLGNRLFEICDNISSLSRQHVGREGTHFLRGRG